MGKSRNRVQIEPAATEEGRREQIQEIRGLIGDLNRAAKEADQAYLRMEGLLANTGLKARETLDRLIAEWANEQVVTIMAALHDAIKERTEIEYESVNTNVRQLREYIRETLFGEAKPGKEELVNYLHGVAKLLGVNLYLAERTEIAKLEGTGDLSPIMQWLFGMPGPGNITAEAEKKK